MRKHMPLYVLLIVLLSLIPFIYSISFLSGPTLTANPTTETDIVCSWTPSNDVTQVNVTWFNGSNIYAKQNNIPQNYTILNKNIARKGEVWTCEVTLYNGSSTAIQNVSEVIVNAEPTEPILYLNATAQSNSTTVYEDTTYDFDVNSSDPDGDTITFSNTGSYFSVDSNDGTFTWTPSNTQTSKNITFTVQDDNSPDVGIVAKIIEFIIVQVNDSPVLQAINDQTATEGVAFYPTITVTDEENDANNFSLSYTQVNGDGSLSSLVLNKMTGFTANLTFNRSSNAPIFAERGNYSVTITVFDAVNASRNDSETFNLEIIPLNQLPVLDSIPNASGTQGSAFFLEINSTDNDTDDTSSFSITPISCSINNPWSITTTNSSNNGTGTINQVLTNDHVICPNVTITVQDSNGATDSQNVYFNITNTNDAPEIYDYSNANTNTGGNNLTNLTGANGARFTYTLNFTDIDSLTYEGESLTITTNESLFSFDNNGIMNFTINDSHVGNWSINVTVSDDEGLSDSRIMTVEFVNNTIPSINNLSQDYCQEDVACTIYVSATDPDVNENITFTSNTSLFNITYYNDTAGVMQATFNNNEVGNYSILITATDIVSASSNRSFNFEIRNTNDPPIFDMDQDNVADNISLGLIVETHEYYYVINVSDEDLIHGDVLSFNWTLLAGNTSVFNMTKNSTNQGIINFTPQIGDANNYSINITVTDSANNRISQIVNFTIYQKSSAPVINEVEPYWNGSETIFSLGTNTFGSSININFSENKTVTFDVNATDPNGDNLTYTWYVNNVLNKTGRPNILSFNFASEGDYEINVTVEDEYYETTSFLWNLTVNNLNRNPQLLNDLENLTGSLEVNGTTTYSNYFSKFNSIQRFYDADDDTDGNLEIDGNETFNLTIKTNGTCTDQVSATVATFSISGSSLTVTPVKLGECIISFNATDNEGAAIESNNVKVNVSKLDTVVSSSSSSSSSSSGGGGTRTETVVVPITQEVDSPAPLKIIAPGEVVIYKQKTIKVPIKIESNWTETLYGITIEAESNNTEIEMNLSEDSFKTLTSGDSKEITLTITNFREGGPYEVIIRGTVDSPSYVDEELILVNSIEAANDGDTYETKISFARDFFNENKECQELNEVLKQAEDSASAGDFKQAIEYVDAAINGCKYLASQLADIETQSPGSIKSIKEFTKQHIIEVVLGSLGLMIIALGIFFTRKNAFDQ